MARLDNQDTKVTFLSGYSRWYPEGSFTTPPAGQDLEIDPTKPFLELLGPTNGLVRNLEDTNVFEGNHLSIMSRLTWRNFPLIIAGDAQMENWSFFDHEWMLEDKCQITYLAFSDKNRAVSFEKYLKSHSGKAFANKRLW